ncbi:hypothetical protein AN958_10022 [Leucoagaricus sp. SymC.cos]|nr:hypothetical protein AN958_10022 [Leucoagaricus sp. SymC.cos]
MAELPKDGKDWSRLDLDAYRITIRNQLPQNFFGHNPTQLPSNLDPNILTSPSPNDSLSDVTYRLPQYTKLASMPYPGSESIILDAKPELLCAVLRTHFSLPSLIAYDSTRRAQPDHFLNKDDLTILLIVQLRDPTDALTGSTG